MFGAGTEQDEQDLPSLSHLPRLKHLSLAHNGLTSIPREIGKLQMLESLNIAGNQLQVSGFHHSLLIFKSQHLCLCVLVARIMSTNPLPSTAMSAT